MSPPPRLLLPSLIPPLAISALAMRGARGEPLRKAFQASLAPPLIVLGRWLGLGFVRLMLACVLAAGLLLLLMIMRGRSPPLASTMLRAMGRPDERPPGKGALALVVGLLLASWLTPAGRLPIFSVCVAASCVGDSVGSLGDVIARAPRVRRRKSAVGVMLGSSSTFLLAWLLLGDPLGSLLAAACYAAGDALAIVIDDNISIPVLVALGLRILG